MKVGVGGVQADDTVPFRTTLEVFVKYQFPDELLVGAILILIVVPAGTFCKALIPLKVTDPDVPVVPLVDVVDQVPAVVYDPPFIE